MRKKLNKSSLFILLQAVFFSSVCQSELTCSINIHNMWLPAPLRNPSPAVKPGLPPPPTKAPRVHDHSLQLNLMPKQIPTASCGAIFFFVFVFLLPVDFQSESPSVRAAQRGHVFSLKSSSAALAPVCFPARSLAASLSPTHSLLALATARLSCQHSSCSWRQQLDWV